MGKVKKIEKSVQWYRKQLKALRLSIEHWEIDIKKNNDMPGVEDCDLCYLNSYYNSGNSCIYCIIGIDTKKKSCGGTPYHDYMKHYYRYEDSKGIKKSKTRLRNADGMIDYMKDLYKRNDKRYKRLKRKTTGG